MKKIISCLAFTLFVSAFSHVFAQIGDMGYNPNSVRGRVKGTEDKTDSEIRIIYGQPIYESDVMYRTTLWRRINLLERQNLPFFSLNAEITKVIIDGVIEGKLIPYAFDSDPRSDGVSKAMKDLDLEFYSQFYYLDNNTGYNDTIKGQKLFLLELKEDLIFDKRRSRMYWDIQYVTLIMPEGCGHPNAQNGNLPIANFKYRDLYKYFKEKYDNSQFQNSTTATGGTTEAVQAFWYNPQNNRRHMGLHDAMELRLFSSRIIKVANPEDKSIIGIINDEYLNADAKSKKQLELLMSQETEYDLMEYEHNLWEF